MQKTPKTSKTNWKRPSSFSRHPKMIKKILKRFIKLLDFYREFTLFCCCCWWNVNDSAAAANIWNVKSTGFVDFFFFRNSFMNIYKTKQIHRSRHFALAFGSPKNQLLISILKILSVIIDLVSGIGVLVLVGVRAFAHFTGIRVHEDQQKLKRSIHHTDTEKTVRGCSLTLAGCLAPLLSRSPSPASSLRLLRWGLAATPLALGLLANARRLPRCASWGGGSRLRRSPFVLLKTYGMIKPKGHRWDPNLRNI